MHSFSVILDKMEIVAGHNHTVQAQGCMKVFGVVTFLNIMAPCQMQSNIEKKLDRHNLWDPMWYNHTCWGRWHHKAILSYLLKVDEALEA